MEKTIINSAELKRCLKEDAKVENALVSDEKLIAIDGGQAEFTNCTFQDCEFISCFFDKATFNNCSFYSCDMKQVSMVHAKFADCTFTSRMVMCNLSETLFSGGRMKDGYITNSQFDLTGFQNVVFDGIRVLHPAVITTPTFENCSYTMGGARSDEVETAKKNFFYAFGIYEFPNTQNSKETNVDNLTKENLSLFCKGFRVALTKGDEIYCSVYDEYADVTQKPVDKSSFGKPWEYLNISVEEYLNRILPSEEKISSTNDKYLDMLIPEFPKMEACGCSYLSIVDKNSKEHYIAFFDNSEECIYGCYIFVENILNYLKQVIH